jgi:thiol-disulfide isomerase/thioredoxin
MRPCSTAQSLGLWGCAALAVLLAGCPAATSSIQGTKHSAVGKKLGDLHLAALTGDAQDAKRGDVENKVALINFWGTWCPPCVAEFPHIAEIGEKYADRDDFKLFAVSSAPGYASIEELRTETEAFLKERNSDLPTHADVDDKTRAAIEATAGWDGYPTTVIIDREGTIRGLWVGYMPGTEQEMEALLAELLKQS